jgi:uncharacterized membrane protein
MNLNLIIRLIAALACVMMSGVYFAFSTAVMPGLSRLEPVQGLMAMQSINRSILNPLFLSLFVGSAILCALMIFLTLRGGLILNSLPLLAGCVLFIGGSLLVTGIINVPLNDTLEAITPNDPGAPELWSRFLTNWTYWNHVRTASSFMAALLIIISGQP